MGKISVWVGNADLIANAGRGAKLLSDLRFRRLYRAVTLVWRRNLSELWKLFRFVRVRASMYLVEQPALQHLRDRLAGILSKQSDVDPDKLPDLLARLNEFQGNSLDMVELVMEWEDL